MNMVSENIERFFGILKRQFFLILIIFTATSFISLCILFILPQKYSASSLLVVGSQNNDVLSATLSTNDKIQFSTLIETEIEAIRAYPLAELVYQRLTSADQNSLSAEKSLQQNILDYVLARAHPSEAQLAADRTRTLKNSVFIYRKSLSAVIAIEARTNSPALASSLVNTYAQAYLETHTLAKKEALSESETALNTALKQAHDKIEVLKADYQNRVRGTAPAFGESFSQNNMVLTPAPTGANQPITSTLESITQDIVNAELELMRLNQRAEELRLSQQLQVANIRILAVAKPEQANAIYPKPIFGLISIIACFTLACGAGSLVDYNRRRFGDSQDLEDIIPLKALSEIPLVHQANTQHLYSISDLILTSPLSAYSDALRTLGSSIAALRNPHQINKALTITVGSTNPQEGRSTTALALARYYALSGKKTLLIDTDLSNPTLAHYLNTSTQVGLIDILMRKIPDNQAEASLYLEKDSGLSILLGAEPSYLAHDDLWNGQYFNALLDTSKRHFDFIVMDSGAYSAHGDSIELYKRSDVVLLIVKAYSTTQAEIETTLRNIRSSIPEQTKLVSALNAVPRYETIRSHIKSIGKIGRL